MRIPDQIRDEILDLARKNIVKIVSDYLPLTKTGRIYKACCPFHGEKTPSFSVDPERGTARCFGTCGEGGDAVWFLRKMDGISFPEALIVLSKYVGITIPNEESKEEKERRAILSTLAKAEKSYKESLSTNANGGKTYVESRMTPEMVETFGIGFAPKNGGKALHNYLLQHGVTEEIAEKAGLIRKNEHGEYRDVFWGGRVMFPVKNRAGYTIGFAGRNITGEDKFKYINSPETVLYKKYSALFGLDKADLSSGEVFVVEGYLDLMQMWSHGIFNVVAACGTAFTKEHLAALKKLGIRRLNLMFDSDKAGIKATQKTVILACKEEFKTVVYSLPDEQDPDSYFKADGLLENIPSLSGFDFLEKSGIELTGTMKELHRLEKLEKGYLYMVEKIPHVRQMLAKRGNLDKLFSPEILEQIQGFIDLPY